MKFGWEVKHVALAKQLLGAVFIKDDSAVDFGGDLECDTARNICLDDAGDYVRSRGLCGHNHVNAGGSGHLGDSRDGTFDIRWSGLHEVCQLVNDDHDKRHPVGDDKVVRIARHANRGATGSSSSSESSGNVASVGVGVSSRGNGASLANGSSRGLLVWSRSHACLIFGRGYQGIRRRLVGIKFFWDLGSGRSLKVPIFLTLHFAKMR